MARLEKKHIESFKTCSRRDLIVMKITLDSCIKEQSTIKEMKEVIKIIEAELHRREMIK